MSAALTTAALVAGFAVADRFAGGGMGATWLKRRGVPGSLNALAGLTVTLALIPSGLWPLGLAWAVYRNLGNNDGVIDGRDLWETWKRHAWAVPLGMLAVTLGRLPVDPVIALGCLSAYALAAFMVARTYGQRVAAVGNAPWPFAVDGYAPFELMRGAAFGLAVAAMTTA